MQLSDGPAEERNSWHFPFSDSPGRTFDKTGDFVDADQIPVMAGFAYGPMAQIEHLLQAVEIDRRPVEWCPAAADGEYHSDLFLQRKLLEHIEMRVVAEDNLQLNGTVAVVEFQQLQELLAVLTWHSHAHLHPALMRVDCESRN